MLILLRFQLFCLCLFSYPYSIIKLIIFGQFFLSFFEKKRRIFSGKNRRFPFRRKSRWLSFQRFPRRRFSYLTAPPQYFPARRTVRPQIPKLFRSSSRYPQTSRPTPGRIQAPAAAPPPSPPHAAAKATQKKRQLSRLHSGIYPYSGNYCHNLRKYTKQQSAGSSVSNANCCHRAHTFSRFAL